MDDEIHFFKINQSNSIFLLIFPFLRFFLYLSFQFDINNFINFENCKMIINENDIDNQFDILNNNDNFDFQSNNQILK